MKIVNMTDINVGGYTQVWFDKPFLFKANNEWPRKDLPSEKKGDEHKIGTAYKIDSIPHCYLYWEGVSNGVYIFGVVLGDYSPGTSFMRVVRGVNKLVEDDEPVPIPIPVPPVPVPVPVPSPVPDPVPPTPVPAPLPSRADTITLHCDPNKARPKVISWGGYEIVIAVPQDMFDRFLDKFDEFMEEVTEGLE